MPCCICKLQNETPLYSLQQMLYQVLQIAVAASSARIPGGFCSSLQTNRRLPPPPRPSRTPSSLLHASTPRPPTTTPPPPSVGARLRRSLRPPLPVGGAVGSPASLDPDGDGSRGAAGPGPPRLRSGGGTRTTLGGVGAWRGPNLCDVDPTTLTCEARSADAEQSGGRGPAGRGGRRGGVDCGGSRPWLPSGLSRAPPAAAPPREAAHRCRREGGVAQARLRRRREARRRRPASIRSLWWSGEAKEPREATDFTDARVECVVCWRPSSFERRDSPVCLPHTRCR
jgi:hypothetical protein